MKLKVSVCLTLSNGERFLRQQVESILPQLGVEDELVCSDDHSSDSGIQILQSFQDPRIKITASPSINNHVKNFEHAIRQSTGELIFLSDHDDIWQPNKVKEMTQHLQDYDLVLSDCSLIDENDREIASSLFHIQKTRIGLLKNYIKNTYTGCCMAFTRKLLKKALPFPKGIRAHDQWLGLVAEKYFEVLLLHSPLVKHRRHGNNLSTTSEQSKLSWLDQIGYRFTLLKGLSFR